MLRFYVPVAVSALGAGVGAGIGAGIDAIHDQRTTLARTQPVNARQRRGFVARFSRPTAALEFQVSAAHLKHPEELEPGDMDRATASASWFKLNGRNFTAVTAA